MAKKKDESKDKKADKKPAGAELPGTPPPDIPEGVSEVDRLPVVIQAQYIKDLSFENPNAPMPMRKAEGEPNVNVDFSMDARKVQVPGVEGDSYEVVLMVSVHARKGDLSTFITELEYGMMVTVAPDVPQDKVHPLLLIEMPNYMFPYVRQIVSDLTQQAGYLPFLLAPVNFKALYRKRFGGPPVREHKGPAEAAQEKKEAERA